MPAGTAGPRLDHRRGRHDPRARAGPAPSGAEDLGDALLVPGFVDLQVNGVGDVDFATADPDGFARAGREQLAARRHRLLPDADHGAPRRVRAPCCAASTPPGSGRVDGAPGRARRPPRGAVPRRRARCPPRRPRAARRHRTGCRTWSTAPTAAWPSSRWHPRPIPTARPSALLVARGRRRRPRPLDRHLRRRSAGRRRRAPGSRPMCSTAWARCTSANPASSALALDDARLTPSLIADLVHVHPAVVRLVAAWPPGSCS